MPHGSDFRTTRPRTPSCEDGSIPTIRRERLHLLAAPLPPGVSSVSPRLLYRTLAIAEAITWTLLLLGLGMKYAWELGDLGVRVGGTIHGFVFLASAMTAVLVGVNQRWSIPLIALAVVTAIVPYATIPFDLWADRTGRLNGTWRRTATADPRDRGWVDVTLRWFLRHPAVLSSVFVVALVGIFATLLVIGPPGGER